MMNRRSPASTHAAAALAWLVGLAAACVGCAIATQQNPPILATAAAAAPVGEVIPVFIQVVGPPSVPVAAHREDVCAVDRDGRRRYALDLDEAERKAGGIDKLAIALTNGESAAAAVGRSMLWVSGQGFAASLDFASHANDPNAGAGLLMLGTAASLTFALARGSYLAASPEARQRDQVAAYSLASGMQSNWYPRDKSGFVYFPAGEYRGIQVIAEVAQSRTTLWLEWPGGSGTTFDVQSLGAQSFSPGPSTASLAAPAAAGPK